MLKDYKAVMTGRELATTEAKLIGYLGHYDYKGGCCNPSQNIYTYNCITHPRKAIRKQCHDVCSLVITCHFYMV